MKFNLLLILLLFSNVLFGQSKEKRLTEAEQLSNQPGVLIQREFVTIGTVKEIKVQILKIKNFSTDNTKSCLRFDYVYESKYSYDTKIGALDLDEIDALMVTLKKIRDEILPNTQSNYTEFFFISRTGLEAGAYYTPDKKKWTAYIQLEKYDKNSMVYLSMQEFSELIKLVEQAQKII